MCFYKNSTIDVLHSYNESWTWSTEVHTDHPGKPNTYHLALTGSVLYWWKVKKMDCCLLLSPITYSTGCSTLCCVSIRLCVRPAQSTFVWQCTVQCLALVWSWEGLSSYRSSTEILLVFHWILFFNVKERLRIDLSYTHHLYLLMRSNVLLSVSQSEAVLNWRITFQKKKHKSLCWKAAHLNTSAGYTCVFLQPFLYNWFSQTKINHPSFQQTTVTSLTKWKHSPVQRCLILVN